MRCTMTWEEVYTGVIQVEEEQGGIITGINAENGKIYVTYSKLPTELPSPTSDLFGKENANEVNKLEASKEEDKPEDKPEGIPEDKFEGSDDEEGALVY